MLPRALAILLLVTFAAAPTSAEAVCDPSGAGCAFDQASGSEQCRGFDEYGTRVTGAQAYAAGASAGAAGWQQCANDGRRSETRAVGAAAGYGATGAEARWQDHSGDGGSGRFLRAGASTPTGGQVYFEWVAWEGACWTALTTPAGNQYPGCPNGMHPPVQPTLPWGRLTAG